MLSSGSVLLPGALMLNAVVMGTGPKTSHTTSYGDAVNIRGTVAPAGMLDTFHSVVLAYPMLDAFGATPANVKTGVVTSFQPK